jgi:hypothetical protein
MSHSVAAAYDESPADSRTGGVRVDARPAPRFGWAPSGVSADRWTVVVGRAGDTRITLRSHRSADGAVKGSARCFMHTANADLSVEKEPEMIHRILKPKIVLAAVASLLLALAIAPCLAAAAHASTRPQQTRANDSAQVKASRGFDILNYSSHAIKLTSISGDGNFEGRPADGTVVQAGDYTRVEVQWKFLSTQNDTAHFDILDHNAQTIGTFDASMTVVGIDGSQGGDCSTSLGRCTIGTDEWFNVKRITLLDANTRG